MDAADGPPVRALRLSIDSRLENIGLAGVAVRAVCDEVGLAGENGYHVELCLVEAVTNCVRHAYDGQAGHEVIVDLHVTADRLELIVRDRGRPLPPERAGWTPALPDDETPPSDLPEGGRGLFLMRTLMDTLEFSTRGGENVVRMTKQLPAGPVRRS